MKELFAHIILPLPLEGTFTYRVPKILVSEMEVGKRVIVQFGAKKYYSGIVSSIHDKSPAQEFEVKNVNSVLDENPVIYPENIAVWNWVAEYYCCTPGEVMKAAIPAGLKLESATKLKQSDSFDFTELTPEEQQVIPLFKNKPETLRQVQKRSKGTISFKIIEALLEKGCLMIEEKLDKRYKPKKEVFVRLNSDISNEKIFSQKLDELGRAPKQQDLLMAFSNLAQPFTSDVVKEIPRKEVLKMVASGSAALRALADKKILELVEKEVSRLDENPASQGELNLLNPFQEKALNEIKEGFKSHNTVLLHGVTSSGKTEIYSHLIDEAIRKGKQVLYLVPEIALTTQLILRLKRVFGKKVGVYHSRLSNPERVEVWNKIRHWGKNEDDSFQVILGARSAVFLPFRFLGLVVVDEEHENSFKQFDPAPRYNARDMAVLLGIRYKAPVLLGTATPSFETYHNVQTGKFGFVELQQRHGDMELPGIIVSDLQRAYKRKQMKAFLGPELFEKMSDSLENKEQVILFQNRRGYAPFVECMECGWIPKCERCDVSLTYHKYRKQLICHYCGYYMPMPGNCHDCGSEEVKTRGMGTEKIEDELKSLFPSARIARMDLDSTRTKNALEKLVKNLESRKTDILVGTQMVTKGLDFEHVSVVGILNADNLLNFPDFRAHERSYQLMSQVSGRAGRKHRKGTVVIQTSQPDHPVISEIQNHAYQQTYQRQLAERKLFRYPPFYRLVKVVVKHKNAEKLNRISAQLADRLRSENRFIVLGPEYPLIGRVSLWYQKEVWIKLTRDARLGENKGLIMKAVRDVKHRADNSGAAFNIDVDPM